MRRIYIVFRCSTYFTISTVFVTVLLPNTVCSLMDRCLQNDLAVMRRIQILCLTFLQELIVFFFLIGVYCYVCPLVLVQVQKDSGASISKRQWHTVGALVQKTQKQQPRTYEHLATIYFNGPQS